MKKDAGKKIVSERVEEFERNKAILTKKGHGEQIFVQITSIYYFMP